MQTYLRTLLIPIILLMTIGLKANKMNAIPGMMVTVFAGNDTSLCIGSDVLIGDLNASITGVPDGNWFTSGSGYFLPGSMPTGLFSTTTTYVPSSADFANGWVTLTLVSDDPDGPGPQVQVNDAVVISFQSAPTLVCNSNLNISLNSDCEQEIEVVMLMPNPIPPYSQYYIESFNENNQLIPNNILNENHINQTITFSVGHVCGGSSCWGTLFVQDKLPPPLFCQDLTISCADPSSPEDLGFPIPPAAVVTSTGNNTYTVTNFDACSDAILSYQDTYHSLLCSTGFEGRIDRTWFAEDAEGNDISCVQSIYSEIQTLADIIFPPNYDDIDEPVLSCSGNWPSLLDGNPDPVYTGFPSTMACENMESTFDDIVFEECGGGFKVFRSWLVIDWCAAANTTHNQIIKIMDLEAPVIDCMNDFTIETDPYECSVLNYQMAVPPVTDNCSNFSYQASLIDPFGNSQILTVNNGFVLISSLEIGEYTYRIIAEDECNSRDTCDVMVFVEDKSAPFVSCDQLTTVSLGLDGIGRIYASSLDDGSFDNCGIDYFEAAKMTDDCGHGLAFGPYIDFCCSEVNEIVMVALNVVDIHGNSNQCMVEVTVEDKLKPAISCPPDITLDCDVAYNQNDLSEFGTVVTDIANQNPIYINGVIIGYDGVASDNCFVSVEETVVTDLTCHVGTITRTFVATDEYNQQDSCSQTITFVNNNPFTIADITWPQNYEEYGCGDIEMDLTITGEPIFTNEYCSNVAASYTDQIFNVVDSACVKIVREWTVIDWCQFTEEPLFGIWHHTQTIKQFNTVAPLFTSACTDTLLCILDPDVECSGTIKLDASAIDDCTPAEDLQWQWFIDFNDDNNYEMTGFGDSIEVSLDQGFYDVLWIVEDKCGNVSDCKYGFEVKECKLPTPYCHSDLTTVIMPSAGEISVWATDFELNSFDNCTAYEDLQFSFSEDVTDVNRTYNCDSLVNGIAQSFYIELWVTDEAGNQDFCTVVLNVQDNNETCLGNIIDGSIKGNTRNYYGFEVEDVELNYYAGIEEYSGLTMTDGSGEYEIDNIPSHISYELSPSKDDGILDGVSTLDLLLIQKHILKIDTLDSAYDILAADINHSNSISSLDLVSLRKVILGLELEFPNNNSWRFVNEDFVFTDFLEPWNPDENIMFEPLVTNAVDADFIAVKVGDVNATLNSFTGEDDVEARTINSIPFTFQVFEKGENRVVSVIANESFSFEACQWSFDLNGQMVKDFSSTLYDVDTYSFNINNDQLKHVFYSQAIQDVVKGEVIYEIILENEGSWIPLELGNDFRSELYFDNEIMSIELLEYKSNDAPFDIDIDDINIYPNPSVSDVTIDWSNDTQVFEIEILNHLGQTVNVYKNLDFNQKNSLIIPEESFRNSGVYYVKIESSRGLISKTLVHLNK